MSCKIILCAMNVEYIKVYDIQFFLDASVSWTELVLILLQ